MTKEERFLLQCEEYRKKLFSVFGNKDFLPEDGADVLERSKASGNMCVFYTRLVERGFLLKEVKKTRVKYNREHVYYRCSSTTPASVLAVFESRTKNANKKRNSISKKQTTTNDDKHERILRARFGYEKFSIQDAASAFGLVYESTSKICRRLYRQGLLKRGFNWGCDCSFRVSYAFLTNEERQTGKNYDWEEDDDPTNGRVTYELQLYGDNLKRYEEIRAKVLKAPGDSRRSSFGQLLLRPYSTSYKP